MISSPCLKVVALLCLVCTSSLVIATPGIKPRELICDGYGKCRHKIANAMEKVKEAVATMEEDAVEAITEVKDTIADTAQAAGESTKDTLKDVITQTSRAAHHSNTAGGGGVLLHLLGFAVAYGACAWFTLASDRVLATTTLSPEQFEMVRIKLHGVYFPAMAFSVGVALFGHFLCPMGASSFQGFISLLASLAVILLNFLYLEPRATKVAFERMKKEKDDDEDKRKAAAAKARRIVRGWSEQVLIRRLNVVTLVALTWHVLHLARHLHTVDMSK